MEWDWGLIIKTLLCLARTARASGISPEDFFRYQAEKRYAAVQQKIERALDSGIKATRSSCPLGQESRDTTNDGDDENNDKDRNRNNSQNASEQSNGDFGGDNYEGSDEDSDVSLGSENEDSAMSSRDDPEFVICIDEAHNIVVDKIEGSELSFCTLRNGFRFLYEDEYEGTFFAVFPDTASTIPDLAPLLLQILARKSLHIIGRVERSFLLIFRFLPITSMLSQARISLWHQVHPLQCC
ncbi:hypothetical protein Cpir12675_005813 [Ceratocystis pirilliformis]|uniref:Uncharacterized protein n=1 Tax=Ceratocystis pirilliformis TaxID=259994 RepID=A0ABR3YNG6_9PEZI